VTLKRRVADLVVGTLGLGAKLLGPAAAAYVAEHLELLMRSATPGGTLTFVASNAALVYRARSVLSKEPETTAWIDSFAPGCCLWDIGANIGVYSLYAARRRSARVLAFEPAAANYSVLNRNIELNDVSGSVHAYCLAFSGQTQLATLNLTNTGAGGATNNFDQDGAISPYAVRTGSVFNQGMLGFSIDGFIEQFAPPFPDHLKIDVDGIEERILSGARRTLADARLRSVLIELETVDLAPYQRCVAMLTDAGLELQSRGVLQAVGTAMRPMNHIFVRRQA
jgi:FkbM family methyltransferase